MPQVSIQEFEQLPLRVHTFLSGVPVHDVWAIDLRLDRENGPLWLRLTGRPGTKEFIKEEFDLAQSR